MRCAVGPTGGPGSGSPPAVPSSPWSWAPPPSERNGCSDPATGRRRGPARARARAPSRRHRRPQPRRPPRRRPRPRRTMHITYWKGRHPVGTVPDGTFVETITTYRSDGGVQFMAELRAAVTACPTQTRDHTTYRHRILSGSAYGDESMLIEMRYPTVDVEGRPTGGDDVRLISVVRIDGVVMVLYEQGWEAGWSAEGPVVDSFTRTAVSRLRAWLG